MDYFLRVRSVAAHAEAGHGRVQFIRKVRGVSIVTEKARNLDRFMDVPRRKVQIAPLHGLPWRQAFILLRSGSWLRTLSFLFRVGAVAVPAEVSRRFF